MNEAALNAARYNQKVVRMVDFEFAKDKVLMGAERRSMIISESEKRITAIHESGHALLAVMLPHAGSDPQGDDHSARHGARSDDDAADRREAQLLARLPPRSDLHSARRPHRRRDHDRAASRRAPATIWSAPPTSRARWSASGA